MMIVASESSDSITFGFFFRTERCFGGVTKSSLSSNFSFKGVLVCDRVVRRVVIKARIGETINFFRFIVFSGPVYLKKNEIYLNIVFDIEKTNHGESGSLHVRILKSEYFL